MDLAHMLKKYMEVVISRGVNLKKGQDLLIDADVSAVGAVHEAVTQAYLAGAGNVDVYWRDKELEYHGLMNEKGIYEFDRIELIKYEAASHRRAALIRIETPNFEIFKDVPDALIQNKSIHERSIRQKYIENCGSVQNCVVCVPNTSWAGMVFPELCEAEALEKLWESVFIAMRLTGDKPVECWDQFVEQTRVRRNILERKNYEAFHFKSAKTDLTICPIENASWYGGCSEIAGTTDFYIPNMPTEEIFTVPDKYSANGIVASTKPLNFEGKIIENFTLEFKRGKVIRFTAGKGEEMLGKILQTDEGACYLGEIAFVACDSPIAGLDTVFFHTLYDENASCHLALGFGLEDEHKSKEEREQRRINTSSLHVDFMIGSEDMCVKGKLYNGMWENIFMNGKWVEERPNLT